MVTGFMWSIPPNRSIGIGSLVSPAGTAMAGLPVWALIAYFRFTQIGDDQASWPSACSTRT